MLKLIECEGAPRDLGLDQGAVCARAVCARLDERGVVNRRPWLPRIRRLAAAGALGGGVGREVLRHHPHLAERMSGIARAADASLDSLMELLVGAAYRTDETSEDPLAQPALGCAGPGDARELVLARTFPASAPWILRRSRPEIGFESLEVALPWSAASVAGFNDRGIAMLAAPVAAPMRLRGLGAPPAWLLVQECLQRFDSLDAAIDWCLKRPAAGSLTLLLGDEHGDAAAVEFSGEERRLAIGEEFLLAGEAPEGDAALRKQLTEAAVLTPELLTAPLGSDGRAPQGGAAQVWLEPRARSLTWRTESAEVGTHALPLPELED